MSWLDLTLSISSLIMDSLVDSVKTKNQAIRVKRRIANVFEASLRHIVDTFSYEWLSIHLEGFLQHDDVQRELSKLVQPYEKPRTDWLCSRWSELYGDPRTDLSLVFSELFRDANIRLAQIPELAHLLALKTVARLEHDQHEGFLNLQKNSASYAAVPTVNTNVNLTEMRYEARIDMCRSLYQDNRPAAAITQLLVLEKELRGEQTSTNIRFRVHTLIGACALAQGDVVQCIDRFQKAYDLRSEDPIAQGNRALVHLLNKEMTECIQLAEKALLAGKTATNARAVRALALAALRNYKNLDDLVDDEFLSDQVYVRALGTIFLQARIYDRAVRYFKICISQDERDLKSRLSMVTALLSQVVSDIEIGLSAFARLQPDSVFKEVTDLVNSVVAQARLSDNTLLYHDSLVERAQVKAATGEYSSAKDDLEQVLRENGGYEPAIYYLGLVQMNCLDLQGALVSFEKIPQGHRQYSLWLNMIWCYLELNRLNDARYALDKAAQLSNDLTLQFLNALMFIKEGNSSQAMLIRDALSQTENTLSYRFAALISRELGDREREQKLLERGYEIALDDEKERLAAELGVVLFEKKQYPEAVKYFKLSGAITRFNRQVLKAYVGSLFYSKSYQLAFQEAENAHQLGIIDPVLLKTQAWIKEAVGDLNQASYLYEILQGLEPTEVSHSIDIMRCRYFLGDIESVRKVLGELKVKEISNPTVLLEVAELLALVGDHVQAVNVAYRALQLGKGNPAIHQAYIRLFLSYDDELIDLKPNIVSLDVAVRLKSDRDTRWVKILSKYEPRERLEVAVNSSLASQLIGHAVGEIIQLRVGDLEELKYEIIEIQSVLVRAFQESLDDFGTLFPDNLQLQRAQIKDGDVSSILMQVARMGIRAQDILNIYETGRVPLESTSILLGQHRYDVQRGICMGGQGKFLCSDETSPSEYTKILETTVITVDLSALVTLQLIGLLSKLTERFTSIYVPTQLLEELVLENDARRNWKSKTKHTLGFSDGHWQMTDIPKAVLDDDASRFEELLNYVQNACTALPVDIEHTGLMADPEGHMRVLGRATLATLLVAQQTETLLYTDDRALRALARHEYGCTGFWTFSLLSDLQQRSLITDEVFQDAVMQLILANYQYVPVSSEVLMRVIKSGMSIDSRTRKVMAVLTGVSSDETTAIQVAAKVLGDVYLDRDLRLDRTFVLHAILASLIAGRIPGRVLHKLLRRLAVILRVAPVQLSQLEVDIQDWQLVVAPTLTSSALGGLRPGS